MTAKIVRVLLVFTTILILGFYLPDLFRSRFEKRAGKRLLYYSEVKRDFVFSEEVYDSLRQANRMVYCDRSGNPLTENEYARLLPFDNARKLKMLGMMPDSLMGEPLTQEVLRSVRRVMLVGDRGFDFALAPLFESCPGHPGVDLPHDLFRIGRRGIEFIDAATNSVDTRKSRIFDEALREAGFRAPARDIFGIPSTIKSRDDGYFVVDARGKLFHLLMVHGAPRVKAIDNDFEIKQIKCHVPGEIYCHIFTPDNELYALLTDYTLKKLPLGKNNGRFMLTYNRYFRSYKNLGQDSSTMYVLDRDFEPVDRCAIAVNNYRNSPAAAAEERIFPFRIMLTPGYAHFIPIPNPVRQFWPVNLFFVLLLVVVKRLNRCRLTGAFHLVDLALTAVFGIYGFIAVLIFPNRY